MDDDKTIDELLDNAIRDAFDGLKREHNEDNLKEVKVLMELQREKDKVQNDYYVRATEVDNETQRLVDEEQRDKMDRELLMIIKRYIPELIRTGLVSLALTLFLMIIKKYEKDGYLVKLGEIGSKFLSFAIR